MREGNQSYRDFVGKQSWTRVRMLQVTDLSSQSFSHMVSDFVHCDEYDLHVSKQIFFLLKLSFLALFQSQLNYFKVLNNSKGYCEIFI